MGMMGTDSRVLRAIGLMSGTSLDGIDAAILETDGTVVKAHGPSLSVRHDGETRAHLIRAVKAALEGRDQAADIITAADMTTSAHLKVVRDLLSAAGLHPAEIDVIGFHGQTILHRPPADAASIGRTWQIGSGAILAHELGIDVVEQFRLNDMKHGGEGAPLAPAYHAALAREIEGDGPLAVLNLGGVGNLTFVPRDRENAGLIAFDCGPGNGLVDQWVHLHTGAVMDHDGALAAAGVVDEQTVRLMALNAFLRRPPPKSLDRYDFKLTAVEHLNVPDGAATLTAFTAECVARAFRHLPEAPASVIVCGGGRHNPTMMAALAARVPANIRSAEAVGWRGDLIEAECFAYLAVRALKGLPISWPKTTRAPHALTGGQIRHRPV